MGRREEVMRLTNYFLHPGDNRYYVFTFQEDEHASRFEKALSDDKIPFERNENEFGVPRNHFNEALKHNHLLYADIREPFLTNKGLRWGVLVFTGLMLLLAIVGAMSTSVYGQQMESSYGWELAFQARLNVPFALIGSEAQTFEEDGLKATWEPLVSQSFGVRLNHRLKESWTIGTGIMLIRRNYSIQYEYHNDTLGINSFDTIPMFRASCYRIPIVAETRVPLGNGYFITASAGTGLEFSPSDFFVNGYTLEPGNNRDYEAYMGKRRWGTAPIIAEFGFEKQPKGETPGYYLGVYWSRSLGRSYWVEQKWFTQAVSVKHQDFLTTSLAGIELRILLK
jgi:hypothetical protein